MIGDATAFENNEEKISAFVRSDVFEKLFSDGMDLVEETAFYLDGEGRQDSKRLDKSLALSYASESMRLTTRLMQTASWLLVQRAVKEGEMSARDARDPKYRIGAKAICAASSNNAENLPAKLATLLNRSESLYLRIDRLDKAMFIDEEHGAPNPVNDQMQRLHSAFGIVSSQD